MTKLLAFGSDIECFGVGDDGSYRSMINKLPGTKDRPFPLPNGGGLQVDNVLGEYNVPPGRNGTEMVQHTLETQMNVVPFFSRHGLSMEHCASQTLAEDQLKDAGADVIGCEPDFNAWTGEQNPHIDYNPMAYDLFFSGLRTAGFHMHFSLHGVKDLRETVFKICRQADLRIGLRSLFYDKDNLRRRIYGKAGACRVKEYRPGVVGGEYRVLSAYFANPMFQGQHIKRMFNDLHWIVENIDDLSDPPREVEDIINNSSIDEAEYMLNHYKVAV